MAVSMTIDRQDTARSSRLEPVASGYVYHFACMASPCEVRMETSDEGLALRLGQIVENEARRIETEYSRYRDDSVLSRINASGGRPVELDEETAGLIDFADQCWKISGGRFDITSGVLRRVWRFDGSDRVPTREQVRALKPLIGWHKVTWRAPQLVLPKGMELDLGGLGKEYAVDRAVMLLVKTSDTPVLVNFGGDLRVSGPRRGGGRWRAAIEATDTPARSEGVIEIASGALTTSGDARRFLLRDGVRYSHILDPRTGWPVKDPPHSVTVAAPTCIEAGFLSTLAMLHGRKAEAFLKGEGVKAWWVR
jgi:thiamine biosynthesis lipoprotein